MMETGRYGILLFLLVLLCTSCSRGQVLLAWYEDGADLVDAHLSVTPNDADEDESLGDVMDAEEVGEADADGFSSEC